MSFIIRSHLSALPFSGGGTTAGSVNAIVHVSGYGATHADDVDLVTIYTSNGAGVGCTANLNGVAVSVVTPTGSTSSVSVPLTLLNRLPMKPGMCLFIAGSNTSYFYGFVHRIRNSATYSPPANGSSAAYVAGFATSIGFQERNAEIVRFDYTSLTSAFLSSFVSSSVLNGKSGSTSGCWNSTYAYFVGGEKRYHNTGSDVWTNSDLYPSHTTSFKLTFSTEAVSTIAQVFSTSGGKGSKAGVTQDSTRAHFIGGLEATGTRTTRVDKLTFSGETIAASGTTLPSGRRAIHNSTAMNSTNGYYFGGITTVEEQDIGRIAHATSTHTQVATSQFGSTIADGVVIQDSTATYAYISPGSYGSAYSSTTWRFVFGTETNSAVSTTNWGGSFTTTNDGSAARISKSTKGYVFFGSPHSALYTAPVVRYMDFTSETWTFVPSSFPLECVGGDTYGGAITKTAVTS